MQSVVKYRQEHKKLLIRPDVLMRRIYVFRCRRTHLLTPRTVVS